MGRKGFPGCCESPPADPQRGAERREGGDFSVEADFEGNGCDVEHGAW